MMIQTELNGQMYFTFDEFEKAVGNMSFDEVEELALSLMSSRRKLSEELDSNDSLILNEVWHDLSKKISIVTLRMAYAIMED